MPRRHLNLRTAGTALIDSELAAVRARMEIPEGWSPEVLAEVEQAARAPRLPLHDATALPLFTVDPPDSRDLDQAMHLERRGSGYRVHYAIADVGAFVRPGGAIDAEARRRVETLYFPDVRVPLHPPQFSEGAASLLPGQDAPALLWQLDLDEDGVLVCTDLRRALVRSRRKLDYAGVQQAIDSGTADEALALLGVIGPLREEREQDRGGISLPIPEQEIEPVDGGYALSYRAPRPADGWNAQISLLTGMAAAELMIGAKVGILRTMPAPQQWASDKFRRQTIALGRPWPTDQPYGAYLRTLDTTDPKQLAIMHAAGSLFRGAGYTAFDGSVPSGLVQAAVGASYTHATAPLRRLVDRFVLVVCEAIANGRDIPSWAREALPSLPGLMEHSSEVTSLFEHRAVDTVEAAVLSNHVGETFDATVVSLSKTGGSIQLTEPAVTAHCNGALVDGSVIRAKLVQADIPTGQVTFKLA